MMSSESIPSFDKMTSLKIRKKAFKMDRQKINRYLEKSSAFEQALDEGNFWQMKLEHRFPIEHWGYLKNYDRYPHNDEILKTPISTQYRKVYEILSRIHLYDSMAIPYGELHRREVEACRDLNDKIKEKYHSIHKMMFKLEEPCNCPNDLEKCSQFKERIASERKKIVTLRLRRLYRCYKIAKEFRDEVSENSDQKRLDDILRDTMRDIRRCKRETGTN